MRVFPSRCREAEAQMRSYASRLWKDHTVHLWDTETGECKGTLYGHRDVVNSVAFSPERGVLVSGSSDGTVLVWKITD